ncbi:hypothetical protein FS837_010689, partial [Tulasnella sp. UAMH 9824]
MSLLGPIIKHVDGWDWERGFPSGDMTRFASYAKRVRSLSYCPENERDGVDYADHMSSHVPARWLYYMASYNGPEYLLPQIRKIVWDSCNERKLQMIIPFLSPTIEDIRIRTWYYVKPVEIDLMLEALATMLPPGVRVFHFITHDERPKGSFFEVNQSLLQPLDELQELRLPSHLMAPVMFKGRLRVLEVAYDVDSATNAHVLLSQLTDTCPLLEHLRIMFYGVRNITFPLIRPLLRCSKLRSLDMEYGHDFDLEAAEVIEMGTAWRDLEVLHIASRHASVEYDWWDEDESDEVPAEPTGGLSFALLVVFAEYFSTNLCKLGLKFSTQDIPAPPDPPVFFPNLEVLYVGSSPLDDDSAKVAKAFAFLSRILPKEVILARSNEWVRRNSRSVFDPDAAAAQVCRTWMDPALDTLWEELDSVNPIMRLLGPISLHSGGWDWDRGFPKGDPARFESYCKRIKSLSYVIEHDVRAPPLPEDEDEPIRRMRPQVPAKFLCYITANQGSYLLPEIRTLRWSCNNWFQLHMVVPFISPTIKDIIIHYFDDIDRNRLFQALRAVIPPSLRVLHFGVNAMEGAGVNEALTAALEGWEELQELRLPFYPLAPVMFKPHIRVLEAAFSIKSSINLEHLLSQLADTCSFLEHLRISFNNGEQLRIGFDNGDMLDFQLIRPLLRCTKLRILDLDYRRGLDFNTKDIQEMGNAWREMEMLHIMSRRARLSGEPLIDLEAGIPIGSLITFAESFSSKLRQLYLHLDTRFIPTPPISPTIFPNLEILHIGTSLLSGEEENVSKAFAFLSAILPPAITIHGCWGGLHVGKSVFNEPPGLPTPRWNPGWLALKGMLSKHAMGTNLPEMTDRAQDDSDRRGARGAVSTAGIIKRILGSLQKPELAAAAQVCHTWMDPALDALWEELDSVNPIMRLLGPVSLQSDGWDWDHGFPRGDPARFVSYCKRIKSLSYVIEHDVRPGSRLPEDEDEPIRRMRPQVPAKFLCYIAANHGSYLLPQIRTLRWSCNNWFQLHMVVPFISPTIKDIIIHYFNEVFNEMDRDRLFQALRAVIPSSLRALHFVAKDIERLGVNEEVTAALEGREELQELRLPLYPLTAIMFKPHIRVLEAAFSFKSGIKLEHLLSQLADTCCFLEHLRITFDDGDMMDFQLIRPLLRCPKLRSLDLDYRKMLDFNTKDIQEMGNAWREMEMLHITSRRAMHWGDPPMDLGAGTPIGSLIT